MFRIAITRQQVSMAHPFLAVCSCGWATFGRGGRRAELRLIATCEEHLEIHELAGDDADFDSLTLPPEHPAVTENRAWMLAQRTRTPAVGYRAPMTTITLADLATELGTSPEAIADFDQSREWAWADLASVEIDRAEADLIRSAWAAAAEQQNDR